MTTPTTDYDRRLLELSEQACNGTLTSEGYIQLDEMLQDDRASLKFYLEYLHLHSYLGEFADRDASEPVFRFAFDPQPKRTRRSLPAVLAVLLPLVVVSALIVYQTRFADRPSDFFFNHPTRIATVVAPAQDAIWSVDNELRQAGVQANQTVYLEAGWLELIFHNGTRVVAQAPAKFLVRDGMSLLLDQGTLRASVQPGISGFRIGTDTMDIVDLGTEFYVDAVPGGASTSFVSQGECEIRGKSNTARSDLQLRVGEGGCVLTEQAGEPVSLSGEQSRRMCEQMVSEFMKYDLQIVEMSPSLRLLPDHIAAAGDAQVSSSAPTYLIPERHAIQLEQDLVIGHGERGDATIIPAGTWLDSYLLRHSFGKQLPEGTSSLIAPSSRTLGHVRFSRPIVGIVVRPNELAGSAAHFTTSETRELSAGSVEQDDSVLVSPTDRRRLDFDFTCPEGDIDQARILVLSNRNPLNVLQRNSQ